MRVIILMPIVVHVSDAIEDVESEVVAAAAQARTLLNRQGFPTLARAPQVFAEDDADHAKLKVAIEHSADVTILS
ncbi:MAG: hypothetical protein HUU55_15395 [Myxococcales bacterium]|nr:hypothetical protein [Myxococcales bacterium]